MLKDEWIQMKIQENNISLAGRIIEKTNLEKERIHYSTSKIGIEVEVEEGVQMPLP